MSSTQPKATNYKATEQRHKAAEQIHRL